MMGVIVPYRNREAHLKEFLLRIKEYLKQTPYQIFIIEQSDNKPFNRGKLLNAGFDLAKSSCLYMCFHDVDMLPLNADYSYPDTPTHLAEAVEQFNFEMPYPTYFGGVTLFNNADFQLINGYSNEYWGWGAEDDDLRTRCEIKGLQISHRNGFFSSLDHTRPTEDDPLVRHNQEKLEEILYGPSLIPEDGLKTLTYQVLEKKSASDNHHYKVAL